MTEEWLQYLKDNAPELYKDAIKSIKHGNLWRDNRIAKLEKTLYEYLRIDYTS